MRVLITGGAGYIGSNMVYKLVDEGYFPFVIDDLSSGDMKLLPNNIEFEKICIGSGNKVTNFIKKNKIDIVIHFAAKISVPESVKFPLKYFINNTNKTNQLIASCMEAGINKFIFSSTAAVYGAPKLEKLIKETDIQSPENPYGLSKLQTEKTLYSLSELKLFRSVILRYFNVAGADPLGRTGQISKDAKHLIKVGCETAYGKRKFMEVFGNDYNTKDGTGIRDYIHVADLVNAHFLAIKYLKNNGQTITLNCGYGKGYSVFDVINTIKDISKKDFKVKIRDRRKGDVSSLIADNSLIKEKLNWKPEYDQLRKIISDSLIWESKIS